MDFRAIGRRVSNWGRWGESDRRGTLNLITPERRAAAAGLVRAGRVFDLAIPLDGQGPFSSGSGTGRTNPLHFMAYLPTDKTFPGGAQVADDWIMLATHSTTHLDGLGHVGYDGLFYNGVAESAFSASGGASELGIENIAGGVVGRGVLLDIARRHGVEWLDSGYAITPDDLDASAAEQGVEVRAGDVLLVRTGWWDKFLADRDVASFRHGEPGLSLSTADWLHERDVAVVASDNWGVEVSPAEDGATLVPLHCVLIRDLGMTLGEFVALRDLSADCAADGVWEFLFCAAPLRITGGVGTPVSPLAIK